MVVWIGGLHDGATVAWRACAEQRLADGGFERAGIRSALKVEDIPRAPLG